MKHLSTTKTRIAAVIILAVATLGAGVGSLAILNDAVPIHYDQQVATIDVTVNGANSVTFPTTNWYDANSKKWQPLVIRNNGNAELRYSVVSDALNNPTLNAALAVSGRFNSDTSLCTVTGWPGLGATGPSDVTPDTFDIGNPAQGSHAGDRLLAAGQESMLCIQTVYLGGVTDQTVLDWTLQVVAEQTFQNP